MKYAAELKNSQVINIVDEITDPDSLPRLLSEWDSLWAACVPASRQSPKPVWLFGGNTWLFDKPFATATLFIGGDKDDSVIVDLKELPRKDYDTPLFRSMLRNINPGIFRDKVWLGATHERRWNWVFLPKEDRIVRPSRVILR